MDALAQIRSRAGDDERDARGLRGGDSHVGGGDVSVTARRHVTASDVDRNQALAGDQARMYFHREFANRLALRLREAPHAVGGEFDIAPHAGSDVTDATLDLLVGHDDVASPLIEFRGVIAHRLFAAALDFGKHFRCDPARIARFGFRRFGRLFQMYDRHGEIPLETFFVDHGTMAIGRGQSKTGTLRHRWALVAAGSVTLARGRPPPQSAN